MEEIRRTLKQGTFELEDSSVIVDKARESLSKRRGTTANLKSRIMNAQENEDSYFITEVPIACVGSFGGGFMPHAPLTARNTMRFAPTNNSTNNEDLIQHTSRQHRGMLYKPFLPKTSAKRTMSPPHSARRVRQTISVN